MSHKGIAVGTGLYRFVDDLPGNPDHFASLRITVSVGKRLEIVQVRITEGKLSLLQSLFDFPFYGHVSRQAGQGTGIKAYLLQFLESVRHAEKIFSKVSQFVAGRDLRLIGEISCGNAVRRPLKLSDCAEGLVGEGDCDGNGKQ